MSVCLLGISIPTFFAYEGERTELDCPLIDQRSSQVRWKKGESSRQSLVAFYQFDVMGPTYSGDLEGRVSIDLSKRNILVIHDIRLTDDGYYICKAQNSHSSTMRLNVYGEYVRFIRFIPGRLHSSTQELDAATLIPLMMLLLLLLLEVGVGCEHDSCHGGVCVGDLLCIR